MCGGFHLEVEGMPSSKNSANFYQNLAFGGRKAASWGWRGFQVCVAFVCALCGDESVYPCGET